MADITTLWNSAQSAFGLRRFRDALVGVEQLLAEEPHNTAALQLAALAARELGDMDSSLAFFTRAAASAPWNPGLKLQLGAMLQAMGRGAEAKTVLEDCVAMGAPHPQAYVSLAQLQENPEAAIALLNRGGMQFPTSGEIPNNIGLLLASSGQVKESIPHFRRAQELMPDLLPAHLNLGKALAQMKDATGATQAFRRAGELQPMAAAEMALILESLGDELLATGRIEDAEIAAQGALNLDPEAKGALLTLALLCYRTGRIWGAKGFYEKALVLDPEHLLGLNNYGNLLKSIGRAHESVEVFRKAVSLHPQAFATHSNLLFAMNDVDELTPTQWLEAHGEFARALGASAAAGPITDPNPARKLRVGLVSGDFQHHSCWYFFECLFEFLDRDAFDLIVFSVGEVKDQTTTSLRKRALEWYDLSKWPLDEAEALVKREAVDVLVDLSGHSALNRLALFARRPAPVQLTWLGYPNTTGLDCFDGRITDEWADPAGAEAQHTEPLLRIEGGFLAYTPLPTAPKCSAPPSEKNGFITFGSFNALHKQNDRTLHLWARVLNEVPHSRLLLKARQFQDEQVKADVFARAMAAGIPAPHLDLMAWDTVPESHLERYNLVDIGLDPTPYNGTATTCEALWMGVPVVTIMGDRHAGRVGASLLNQIGLTELIAATEDAYVDISTALARDPIRLAALRSSLRPQMAASSLCDGRAFVRKFEALLRDEWRMKCVPPQ